MSTLPDLSRRRLMASSAALGLLGLGLRPALAADAEAAYAASPFRKLSEADWKKRLPATSFNVLRHEGTEYPFTSPLLGEHRKGTFVCLGCELPLFKSDWKYDSHTGWPSFWKAIYGALGHKRDLSIGMDRTEYHCARCLGHQGHIFDDGPQPTGLRYCNNGVAVKFVPA
ncbi:peptide-methionine (R)-S-oxide reductase MsrB [Phenylobacterium montanum]|uniref:peptide-methionine (R)-S-oxide reductase n=1 Tax=Phenylobacterium montanum TaxID=2823693 RepID=A0A975G134_9CAUL|nr:peptide-methionine (R)-S-oxide reductase MsrB [Caulobacter sp. S6]QUD88960.1 peptide-methionine (R)-S-oxide reductase MsrB [Caulobacter sp. S6]